jgi:hypothetical protein
MKVMMTLTLTETKARQLWERCAEPEGDPPLGQDLADWLAEFCGTTIESNFQFDASVDPDVNVEGHSNTLSLLNELDVLDNFIASRFEEESPRINAAKERRANIKATLVASDDARQSEQQLQHLREAYAPLLGVAHGDEGAVQ